ncbi:MAG: glycosyltransferase family 2 protein [Zavarzinella sp.]
MSEHAKPMPNKDLWIVIAAYNESKRIGNTIAGLQQHGYRNIVVVDDGSADDTYLSAKSFGIHTLRHVLNCGQGAALQTGIQYALRQGAHYICTFDADGQHAANEIPQVLEPVLQKRVDVTLGSRFLGATENIPLSRKLVLKGGVIFTRVFSRVKVTDAHNGFRVLSRNAAEKIRIRQNRMAHASEILDEIRTHDLRFEEVPVTIRYNADTLAKGQSSWNAFRIVAQLVMGRLVG